MQYPTSAISRSAYTLRRPHQTNPVRHIARLMALVALFGVGGGCPQNLPPEAEWIDPTTGTVSETSGVEGDDGPSADNPLYVSDLAAATVQGQPVTLTLSAEVPSGVNPEAGGQLFLSIVSAPYKGFVGPPEPIALDTLSAVYTPPDDFVGECYFTYVLYDGTRSSNVGTVSITVYPRIYFTVEPADGPGDLTVHTYAYTLGGHSLPDGNYTWSFDGEEDSGPMATHWERWHTFAPGSLQVVTLSVTLAGLATPLGCVKSPEISGWVADGSGAPIAGVEIAASDVKAVITDNEGQYRLPVPHLWSGTVKASRPDHTFDPPSRVYANLTEDVAEQNFEAGGGQPPNQPGDVMISGYVRDTDSIGITGVTLSASNGGGSAITYGDGHYELTVPNDWSGTVVPSHPGYTFSPPSRSYSNVTADNADENYQGTANPVNGPPIVYDQADVTPEDTKKLLTLSGSDPDSDDLTFEIVSGPSHGVLVEMDNSPTDFATVMYTPVRNFNGDDSFTFSAHDGHGGVSAAASFTITVDPLNDAPVIDQGMSFSLVVDENSSADDNHFNLSATDPDQGTILTWSISADPTHGLAAIVGPVNSSPGEDVTFSYAPDPDYTGADSFAIFVNDNDGGSDSIVIDVAIGGFHISGTITRPIADGGTQAVPDLTLAFTGDSLSGTATTYADGHYTLFVPVGWSGTVQAQEPENWVLTPDHLDYTNVQESLEHQDYSAVRNYYVDDDGSQQPGYDPIQPLGFLTNPYSSIQEAADEVEPGDTIIVRSGYYQENFIRFANTGLDGRPITIAGYNGEEVILCSGSGAHWVFDFSDQYSDLMHGFGHYVFRNFMIHGSRMGWYFNFPGTTDKNHHITIEDIEAWDCEAIIKTRRTGVEYLTIRRCNFYECTATEGAIDIGNNQDAYDIPQSASRHILVEDTDLHDNNINQQCNGIVTQGNTAYVTLRRVRAWNNGKYGFALKGSGNTHVDRCSAWGNRSTQLYMRGMVESDPPERTADALHDVLVTNTILIGPRDGIGAVLCWREHSNIRVYNCTIVALRDETMTNSGSALGSGERHNPPHLPVTADIRNSIFATWDGSVTFLRQANGLDYWQMRRYEACINAFYRYGGGSSTLFHYQNHLWQELGQWQNYWATGEPNGDDRLNGPMATYADANSLWCNPLFSRLPASVAVVPVHWAWPDYFWGIIDVTPQSGSPIVGVGDNLSNLDIPALMVDYNGDPRPAVGPWTIGALR